MGVWGVRRPANFLYRPFAGVPNRVKKRLERRPFADTPTRRHADTPPAQFLPPVFDAAGKKIYHPSNSRP
jgi:hypothetical protein